MSGSRDFEETERKMKERPLPMSHLGSNSTSGNDIWDQFVQDNWAPALASTFGPDWRDKHPEEVTAILWWAMSQGREADGDDSDQYMPGMDAMSPPVSPRNKLLTFGSFQPTTIEESKRIKDRQDSRLESLEQSLRTTEDLLSKRASGNEALQDEWDDEEDMSDVDLGPLLEKMGFESMIFDEIKAARSEKRVKALSKQRSDNAKSNQQSTSRQERRKAKRSGGTKRQGEEIGPGSSPPPDKHQVTQVEHRIEISGGSAKATLSTRSRSIPSKLISGLPNCPSSIRIPINSSPEAMFHGYSFSGPNAENGVSITSFSSSSPRSSHIPHSCTANSSSIFGFLRGGVSATLEGTATNDWVVEDAGITVDIDDPHHPHKKLHKHFTAEVASKLSKSLKKQSKRHNQRQMPPLPSWTQVVSALSPGYIHESKGVVKEEECLEDLRDQSFNSLSKRSIPSSDESSTRTEPGYPGEDDDGSTSDHPHSDTPFTFESRYVIDRADSYGRCPLHVAAMAGRTDVVKHLLQHRCDVSRVLHVDLLNHGSGSQPPSDAKSVWMYAFQRTALSDISSRKRQVGEKSHLRDPEAEDCQRRRRDNKKDFHSMSMAEYSRAMIEQSMLVDRLSFKDCNALHLAAFYGHEDIVELLLTVSNINKEYKNEHGCTALHIASNRGHKHVVEALIKADCSVDAADFHGLTPLHHAAARGRQNVINVLWPRGCKIDAEDVMGWTPLHYASHGGHVEAVGTLIVAGCRVSKSDSYGLTPGHLAAYKGHVEVLQKLLHAGFYHDMQGGMAQGRKRSTALHMAAAKGHSTVIKQLLSEGADVHKEDSGGMTPLQHAAEGGHLDAFIVLLEVPSDFFAPNLVNLSDKADSNPKSKDRDGKTLLHSAATGGNWGIFKRLLDLGCDPNERTRFGTTPLHNAALVGAFQVAENILGLGCKISVADVGGNMPWHSAADGGNVKVLELFLSREVDIETKNDDGCTCLHRAAYTGIPAAVEALINKNADLSAVDYQGRTPLHIAAERFHDEALCIMLEQVGPKILALKDREGTTILHLVCSGGSIKAFNLMVQKGADLNDTNNMGHTALHMAALCDSETMVHELLKRGCDTSKKDIEGCTALYYAAQRNNTAIFNRLFPVKGCNVAEKDKEGFGLLHYAVKGGNPEIVGRLLLRGAACFDDVEGSGKSKNALHLACELGHASVASYLIKAQYNVRGKGPKGMEPIHFASGASMNETHRWSQKEYSRHQRIVQMLMEEGADVHVVDNNGCNALMYAAGVGDIVLVGEYLEKGVDSSLLDTNGCSVMHWAATGGNAEIVSKLIKAGVPVDTRDKSGAMPLHRAADRGELSVVSALVEAMAEKNSEIHTPDNNGSSPVRLAAMKGYAEVVTKLLEGPKGKETKTTTGLHLGIQMQLTEIVKSLLKSGNCDVNARDAQGCTPLHYAAETGQHELVEMLLEAAADMFVCSSPDGLMPIHKAAAEGHYRVVEKFIEHGALRSYYSTTGTTPLHHAAASGRLETMKLLLERGVPVNHRSTGSQPCTALYHAASNDSLDAVNLLLDYNAEVDMVCANDCTALHIAATNGRTAIVKRLIAAGADVDFQASSSNTAIHNAVNNGCKETTEALIAADCDIDIQNSAGNTPLHIAACKGNAEIAKILLNAGCDMLATNAKGYQAIHSAASNGFFDVVLLLVQHGVPWRQKGDLDVAKMLCRKSNLAPSYVDGRLHMAERPKKHRRPKHTEALESILTEEELKMKQAQADAVMAELLAEEEKEKKMGDQKQKSKKGKDRRRKSQSISDSRNSSKAKESSLPSDKIDESISEKCDIEAEEKDLLETLPDILLRSNSRQSSDSQGKQSRGNGKQKKKDLQKRKKNRQPATRLPESVRSPVHTEIPVSKKAEKPSLSRDVESGVKLLVKGSQSPQLLVKPAEPKKSSVPVKLGMRELPPKEINIQSMKKSSKKALSRSISVPGPQTSETTKTRTAHNRSMTMAAAVAGQTPISKRSSVFGLDDDPSLSETTRASERKELRHEWADAVKSKLDKKTTSEPKIEVLRVADRKKVSPSKPEKKEIKVKVMNVSSNKKAFLPFADNTPVEKPLSTGTWTTRSSGHISTAASEASTELTASERTSELPDDHRNEVEEKKEPVLKWVSKDSAISTSQSSELKGTRASPIMRKRSTREEDSRLNLSDEPEETSVQRMAIPSPWKPSKLDKPISVDCGRFPPLPSVTSLPEKESISENDPIATGFPFPGRSGEWSIRSLDVLPEPLTSSNPWGFSETESALATSVSVPVGRTYDDTETSSGDALTVGPELLDQINPDSLIPPELKEEITNGGATSNRFRTKNSVNAGQPGGVQEQSKTGGVPHSVSPSTPAWTRNAQGPFIHPRIPPPPPPSSSILSRIPDDPWEIAEVDVSELTKMSEPVQHVSPEVQSYGEHVTYLCPLSRRPITDPVVAADGITYDRASIQSNPAYYISYIPYNRYI